MKLKLNEIFKLCVSFIMDDYDPSIIKKNNETQKRSFVTETTTHTIKSENKPSS